MTPVNSAPDLARDVDSKDPETGLRAVVALRRLLDQLERIHVQNARARGWSWQAIADVLGVSRQAVHKKHGGRRRLRGRGL